MANIFDLFKKIEKKAEPAAPITHIICGLGNPGDKYVCTRHNAGFVAMDYLTREMGVDCNRVKFKALCGEGTLNGVRVLLMKPQTFMNASGEAVAEAAAFYKIPVENITPYLAPVPLRGQVNTAGNLPIVIRKLAQIRQDTPAHIAAVTAENAARFYGIELPE